MLDERDYFSRFVNALLESIERYLHNPKSISEEEIQFDLTKISAYFEKEHQINLLSNPNLINKEFSVEELELLISFYYLQNIHFQLESKEITLKLIQQYNHQSQVFSLKINEIQAYFEKL
ncbi:MULTISPECIES: hypothetical protein [unclassified Empedobacter]|uniref:hypothetical protein n=1 Tax=unclassified Empedobacter TaxID=2643773 RepID=UPI0025BDBC00|nr:MULTISPECIES: hypothetical protein [unclassified Empedobacter]